jgi:signal transduction histidine kinase
MIAYTFWSLPKMLNQNEYRAWLLKKLFLFSISLLFFLIALSSSAVPDEIQPRKLDLSVAPEVLPYLFETKIQLKERDYLFLLQAPYDLNSDGIDEHVLAYTRASLSGFASAVLGFWDLANSNSVFQYNGSLAGFPINSADLIDILNDSKPEIVISKLVGDTAFLEILVVGDSAIADTHIIRAADPMGPISSEGWHDLHITPLAGVDLNGDGFRDLIFSRSAKHNRTLAPDSIIERGIVAYDITHKKQLWFYPCADMVSRYNFHIVQLPDGSKIFVGATTACDNRYASNGMDSRYSYLFAIDEQGKELWRRVIGMGIYYPVTVCLDRDSDRINEIFTVIDPRLPETGGKPLLVCVDARNGRDLRSGISLGVEKISNMTSFQDSLGIPNGLLLSSENDGRGEICLYDLNLHLLKAAIGDIGSVILVGNLIGDRKEEIVISTPKGEAVLLDDDFRILGKTAIGGGTPTLYRQTTYKGIFWDDGIKGFMVSTPRKQALAMLLYYRYRWFLTFLFAGILLLIAYRLVVWVGDLYRAAVGLPGLDKINTLVLVLNRKGKIKFVNKNPLTNLLITNSGKRREYYGKSGLARFPAAIELIRKSYLEPYLPFQELFEIEVNGEQKILELTIYPRMDKNNNFLGKVIIVEDVSGRLNWQRRAVLGDAAQRWIHKLKGSMATAQINLQNLHEDSRINMLVNGNQNMMKYLTAIGNQIQESAETANRILRFARITKPERVEYSINKVIDDALKPFLEISRDDFKINKKLQPDLPLSMIDPEQMMEVVENLISNAIKSLKSCGHVDVSTRLAENLLSAEGGSAVEVVIEDNGIGIAPQDVDNIFKPGFSKSGNGTGLGLAVVKEIVDNHRGKVFVESEVNKGSRFTVWIPVRGK